MAIDLDRVKQYIELGFDKEDALKMVDKETKKEKAEKPPIEDEPTDIDLSGYVTKEDAEKMVSDAVSKALEKANLDKGDVDVAPKQELGDLMKKFF